MKRIEKTFSVPFRHRLLFTRGLFEPDNALLAEVVRGYRPDSAVRLLFVADSGVLDAHPGLEQRIRAYCRKWEAHLDFTALLSVPGGEAAKNSETWSQQVLQAIDRERICRHSIVVAIGGGAVIDMVGYAAAIAHRGVQLLRIPTTVLAQNDAAVGVKNGLNAFGKKNFVGTFAVPLAILNDADFLRTLEDRDWIAGMAEAVKVALIKDAGFFEALEERARALRQRDMEAMDHLIYRCAELHIDHIAGGGDPFESGSSRPLDFGHWAGHKLEHLTHYEMRHGEAVALGMAIDVVYSHLTGWLTREDRDRVLALLEALGFTLELPVLETDGVEALLQGIEEFREHLGGRLTITLLEGLGRKRDVHQIDLPTMRQAIGSFLPGRGIEKAS
ncbi:3-dehydroquinate synthase [Robiginitalea sp. M366]|uniref:3-dehydroquinate synthase n=1 Tax=Robiginitalea aestuariiviva TaxID=3036903 RepID=UPI00240E28CB|nr:3-dehydroquinate synthase [Robiginitalea aestuariiviva]MDG1572614.1 3-dehydroquinate synthase [Robiginitalea aestuariiviva]